VYGTLGRQKKWKRHNSSAYRHLSPPPAKRVILSPPPATAAQSNTKASPLLW
jgi:hypothetical protein